jgi:hypothetical protein
MSSQPGESWPLLQGSAAGHLLRAVPKHPMTRR